MKFHISRRRRRATFIKPTNKKFQQVTAGAIALLIWQDGEDAACEQNKYREPAMFLRMHPDTQVRTGLML
jgi:serine phosphatase RsbU (regulator of sigma subunit)